MLRSPFPPLQGRLNAHRVRLLPLQNTHQKFAEGIPALLPKHIPASEPGADNPCQILGQQKMGGHDGSLQLVNTQPPLVLAVFVPYIDIQDPVAPLLLRKHAGFMGRQGTDVFRVDLEIIDHRYGQHILTGIGIALPHCHSLRSVRAGQDIEIYIMDKQRIFKLLITNA